MFKIKTKDIWEFFDFESCRSLAGDDIKAPATEENFAARVGELGWGVGEMTAGEAPANRLFLTF